MVTTPFTLPLSLSVHLFSDLLVACSRLACVDELGLAMHQVEAFAEVRSFDVDFSIRRSIRLLVGSCALHTTEVATHRFGSPRWLCVGSLRDSAAPSHRCAPAPGNCSAPATL